MKSIQSAPVPTAATYLLAFVSLLATALPSRSANILLLSDHFNTAGGVNADLATRQDGTLKDTVPPGSTWTTTGANTAIVGNQLSVGFSSQAINNADFEASLTSVDLSSVSGFILSFDYTSGGGAGFSSAFLSTHNTTADERANSQFGFLLFGNGSMQVNGSNGVTGVTNPVGFDHLVKNNYSFVATRTTATTGSYNFSVNGVQVATRNYAFGTGGFDNGEVNFQIITNGTGSGLYDNFSLTTVPEPSTVLLGGLGILALLRRRR